MKTCTGCAKFMLFGDVCEDCRKAATEGGGLEHEPWFDHLEDERRRHIVDDGKL